MSKERVYYVTGQTEPAKDGKKRPFTIAAVLTEQEISDTDVDVKKSKVGKKEVTTIIKENISYIEQTLSIGIAIVSPVDILKATKESGEVIASGKARKIKSADLVMTANRKYYTKGVILGILEREANILTKNPDRYVHVSPAKETSLKVVDADHKQTA